MQVVEPECTEANQNEVHGDGETLLANDDTDHNRDFTEGIDMFVPQIEGCLEYSMFYFH